MKDTIFAIAYEAFYKNLISKFYKEFIVPSITEGATSVPDERSKENWKQPYPNTKLNIAKNIFKVQNEFYFYRKYDEEAKRHIEYKFPLYPVTIDKRQFAHGLKYLLLGKDLELIKDFPDLKIPQNKDYDWERMYDKLMALFYNKFFPDGFEKKNEIDNKEINITDCQSAIAKFVVDSIFTPIVFKFFSQLCSKDKFPSWKLLAPEYHEHGVWNGSFTKFKQCFHNIVDIQYIEMIDFWYRIDNVYIWVYLNSTLQIYDLADVIAEKDGNTGVFSVTLSNSSGMYKSSPSLTIKSFYVEYYELEVEAISLNNDEIDAEMIMDYDFQRTLFMKHPYLLRYLEYLSKPDTDNKKMTMLVRLSHGYNNWLIDYITPVYPLLGEQFESTDKTRKSFY